MSVTHLVDHGTMEKCGADCHETKPVELFPRNKNTKDGFHCYCKNCNNARTRESRERLHGGSRHYHLMHRYGIGADDFDRLVAEQGGVCAICGKPDPEHVDHSHDTGEVRGILCFNCNGGLGQFRDSIDTLRSAATYLEFLDAESVELREMAVVRAGELRTTPV
jgi:hypothetical protein